MGQVERNMKLKLFTIILAAMVIFAAALFIGPKFINPFNVNGIEKEILISIRLPRVIVSVLMGMALGASGAVLQGILRNPLADPYILGISSGAALTAVVGIIGGSAFLGIVTIPLLAFIGALITGIFVGAMGWKKGGFWPERLLLAGVGLGFLFSAMLMLIMSISSDEGLRRATLWIFGDLSIADWSVIPYGLVFIAVGFIISISRAKALNALILGDELSHSLGFSPRRERFILFISVGLMTAASVALGGMIGFIGLLIPHVGRFLIGSDSRVLIPVSALGGGMLLCIADLIGKSVLSPMELPAGIVTAIIGAPYFLYLLRRKDVLSI
ncbi:MAG TPA: iron ABC transporter permease [Nitrospirae bacterium]|nr:hemin transport system permease protein HmuU [bacterium BMS3Bbin08]HDH50093.1 iron ABC transporter permease [Nitrospirota bacterium]HDK16373.1 iron ABC transporter permease [Nitrospirota bacterium]HDK82326.1 iron ABC transporter permease [Nitrospirota bacterium]HDO26168.1 iron ABC transporter permease [Nitrospirota bacterium]